MRVRFLRREQVATDIYTFWFEPEQPTRYTAGQFTELYLPHDEPDLRGQRRWFSLSSSPSEPNLSITTHIVDGKRSTFKQALFELQPGAPLSLADPMGDFVLPKDTDIPLVFAAAGMGIAPVRSMVKYLLDTQERRTMRLLQSVRAAEELIFTDLFEAYGLPTTQLISTADQRLTTEHLLSLMQEDDRTLLYLSGPELLVETLVRDLEQAGLPAARLIADYFPGYTQF
ncbi:MAG TPA: FAD-dependent oxidoreductase [Candidatus Saccharimonadales bacterium]|nr:FAD-dependent oxidoreductase [Candidatus Saccharimonadales bacterium]